MALEFLSVSIQEFRIDILSLLFFNYDRKFVSGADSGGILQ